MTSIRNLPTTLSLLAAAAVSLAVLLSPSSAAAATSCEYDSALDFLNVSTTGSNSHVQIDVSGNGMDILVREQGPIVTCTGGQATLTTTDNIAIVDNGDNPDTATPNDGNVSISLPEATALTPGATAEAGDDEIELLLNFNDGINDALTVFGSSAADAIRVGDAGVNWAVGPGGLEEREVLYSEPDDILVDGADGADVISAQGGEGTDDPVDTGFLELAGGNDDDQLSGGNSLADGDWIRGNDGADTLNGFAGNDLLGPGFSDDTVDGGAGSDFVDFNEPLQANGVSVDLSDARATGQGSDTINGVENVSGTPFDDTLTGSDAPNQLRGNSGSDVLDGGAGADQLDGGGGPGPDTVTYADAPAGVTANLTAGTASGGAGADTLADLENLTGSAFDDSLIGDAMANSITGLGGADEISSLGGADVVNVRDGAADKASCGTELDSAEADQRSVDSIAADCETVSFLPEAGGGGDGNGAGPGDGELNFQLKGKKRQDVLGRGGAVVKAMCPLENCAVTAKASGKLLKPATAELIAGERTKVRLRLRGGQRVLPPKINVSATATDTAGNSVTQTRRIRVSG